MHNCGNFLSLLFLSPQEFCSVGDDSCLILWDARAGRSPALKVKMFFLVMHFQLPYINFIINLEFSFFTFIQCGSQLLF